MSLARGPMSKVFPMVLVMSATSMPTRESALMPTMPTLSPTPVNLFMIEEVAVIGNA